jgi:3-phosphoshikimate 1-carboxyvinyltransferase
VHDRRVAQNGAKVEEIEDGMIIEGVRELTAAETLSHGDHRVAMSMAIAALAAKGRSRIKSVEWVETSFPGFLKKLNSLVA